MPFAPPPITWAELGRTLHLSHAVAEALVSVVVKSPELVQRQFYDKLHSRVNAQAGAMLMTACCRVFPRLPDAWILPVLNVVNKIGDETLCTNIVELVARSNFHPDVLEILTAAGNERELRWVAKAAVTCSEADVGKLMVLRREFAEVLEEEEEIGSFHKAVCFDDSSVRLMYMLSRKKEAGGGEQMTMVDEGEEEEEADGGGEVNVNEEQLFDLAKHWGVFDVRGEQGRWRSRIRAGVGYAMVDAVLVKRQGAGKSVAERIQEAVGAPSAPHVKYLLPLGRAAVSSPVLTAVLESDAYIHRPSMFQLNPLLSMARFAAVRSSLEYLWIRCLKVPPKFRQTTAFAIVHAW